MHNLGWDKKAQVLGRVFKTRPKPSFFKNADKPVLNGA